MITIDLSGKTILLTGAMGAIAEHIVRRLAAAGAMLVLLDLKPAEQALQYLREWNVPSESYVYHAIDITDSASLGRVVDGSFDRFPNLDTVLGHAGGCGLHPFATTSEVALNVVSPGNVAAGSSLKVFEEDPAYREFVLRVSLGRRNSPESIADAFLFLCSPLAAEINGQVLSADYGAGSGTAYEDRSRVVPAHVDARVLRFRPAGRLYPCGRPPGRLLQPGLIQPQEQSTHRREV
jgi:NAD(P)-dependent dehydrogenase (short-subunit alcohol dehydrogenase family)